MVFEFISYLFSLLRVQDVQNVNNATQTDEEIPIIRTNKRTKIYLVRPKQNVEQTTNEPQKVEVCCNCEELVSRLSECDICMNRLQNKDVYGCYECGNFWCEKCNYKLVLCPFCRHSIVNVPCVPLIKVINRLKLPCENEKRGCKKLVDALTRYSHEDECTFARVICPEEYCNYKSTSELLKEHLYESHKISVVESDKFVVEIQAHEIEKFGMTSRRFLYKISRFINNSGFFFYIYMQNSNIEVTVRFRNFNHQAIRNKRFSKVYKVFLGYNCGDRRSECSTLISYSDTKVIKLFNLNSIDWALSPDNMVFLEFLVTCDVDKASIHSND